jgi:hypothetical protein
MGTNFHPEARMKFLVALSGALVLTAALASAQALPPTGPTPVIDGVVAANEYALKIPVGKITLSASRTADMVYLAVSAPTTGWVSVGFGSQLMDGADLFLGYVAGGKAAFTQQLGKGHGHNPLAKSLEVRDALRESGGVTTLETAFKAAEVLAGKKELWVLVAYGPDDSFASYHLARGSVKLKL